MINHPARRDEPVRAMRRRPDVRRMGAGEGTAPRDAAGARRKGRHSVAALGAILALTLAVAVLGTGLAPAAGAQPEGPVAAAERVRGGASPTIRHRLCPECYAGSTGFRDCHARLAGSGVRFALRTTERTKRATTVRRQPHLRARAGALRCPRRRSGRFRLAARLLRAGGETGDPLSLRPPAGRNPRSERPHRRPDRARRRDAVVCDRFTTPERQR